MTQQCSCITQQTAQDCHTRERKTVVERHQHVAHDEKYVNTSERKKDIFKIIQVDSVQTKNTEIKKQSG